MSLTLAAIFALQAAPYGGATCNQAEADRGIQFEMNVCAEEDFANADEEMNAVWKLAADKAKSRDFQSRDWNKEGGHFKLLLSAQRAWLEYRDAHCEAESDRYRGGTMRPMVYSGCKAQLTRARTEQLTDYVGPMN